MWSRSGGAERPYWEQAVHFATGDTTPQDIRVSRPTLRSSYDHLLASTRASRAPHLLHRHSSCLPCLSLGPSDPHRSTTPPCWLASAPARSTRCCTCGTRCSIGGWRRERRRAATSSAPACTVGGGRRRSRWCRGSRTGGAPRPLRTLAHTYLTAYDGQVAWCHELVERNSCVYSSLTVLVVPVAWAVVAGAAARTACSCSGGGPSRRRHAWSW